MNIRGKSIESHSLSLCEQQEKTLHPDDVTGTCQSNVQMALTKALKTRSSSTTSQHRGLENSASGEFVIYTVAFRIEFQNVGWCLKL